MDTLQARKQVDRVAVICTMIFALLSFGLMIGFKWQESYFDTHGRISVQAEAARENSQNNLISLVNKRQITVSIEDRAGAQLVVPLAEGISESVISIREEFSQNKFVITIADDGRCLATDAAIITDSRYLKDVMVYKQNNHTIIEVTSNETYAYTFEYVNGNLVLKFSQLREVYDKIAVLYVPYEELQMVFLSEWTQVWDKTLQDYAQKQGMKLYVTYGMQESYTETDIAQFAQSVHADMLLAVKTDKAAQEENIETACNTVYFIPEFGNLELAIIMQEEFVNQFKLHTTGIRESTVEDELLLKSTVPTAMVCISDPDLASEKAEDEYAVNQNIATALMNVLKRVVSSY